MGEPKEAQNSFQGKNTRKKSEQGAGSQESEGEFLDGQ
jgi:hypothetical protein